MFRGSWGSVGLLVAVFLLGSGCVLPWKRSAQPVVSTPTTQDIRAAWNTGVSTTLVRFDTTKNAQEARDALLDLRVTAEDKEAHLRLVLAFQALLDKAKNAEALLKQAREAVEQTKNTP
ncbi:MAG: hypothetical protein WCV84_03790 [Patescibacteria group bacterium]